MQFIGCRGAFLYGLAQNLDICAMRANSQS
jgi:hypothetical protein